MEWFFRDFWESSYVLFGTKPMAVRCVEKTIPYKPQISQVHDFMDSIGRLHLGNLARVKGWETWQKYQHLFPSPHFAIIESHNQNKITITIINRRNFLKKVGENLDFFKETLNFDVYPREFKNWN